MRSFVSRQATIQVVTVEAMAYYALPILSMSFCRSVSGQPEGKLVQDLIQ